MTIIDAMLMYTVKLLAKSGLLNQFLKAFGLVKRKDGCNMTENFLLSLHYVI